MPRCDPGTLLSLDGPGLWDVSASAAPGPADVFTTTLDGSFGPSTGDWLLYGGGSSGGGGSGSSGGVEVVGGGGDFVGSDALRTDYGADFGGIGDWSYSASVPTGSVFAFGDSLDDAHHENNANGKFTYITYDTIHMT